MYKGNSRPCIDCKEIKNIDDFYLRTENKRPKSVCKKCDRKRRTNHKRERPEVNNKWIEENRGRTQRNNRNSELKRSFGITIDDYESMLKDQGGVCRICGLEENSTGLRNLSVDHDHQSGKIRGLLCHNCNTGLGKFKDSEELLKRAIVYLLG